MRRGGGGDARLARRLLVTLAVALVPAAVWTPSSAGAAAGPVVSRSRIAYAAGGLFTADHSGTDVRLVVPAGESVDRQPFNPAFSHDGSRIAYMYDWSIWVVGADGSNPRQLTYGARVNVPSWSADDSKIYFTAMDGSSTTVGWVGADGAQGSPFVAPEYTSMTGAVWSPDGGRVAFRAETRGGGENVLVVMNPDGSGQRVLMRSQPPDSVSPKDWSPDGTRLLAHRLGPSGFDLVVVNADGSGSTTVRKGAIADAWSPDGNRLLFHDQRDRGLRTIAVDGTNERRLGALLGDADWGPGTVDPDPPVATPTTTPPSTAAPVPPTLAPRPPAPGPAPTTATTTATGSKAPPSTAPSGTSPPRSTASTSTPDPPTDAASPPPPAPAPVLRPASSRRAVGPGSVAGALLLLVAVATAAQPWAAALRRRTRSEPEPPS